MAERKRSQWIDIAKGIGILLVILGHITRDSMKEYSMICRVLYDFIYSFHMGYFFFIGGVVFCLTHQKQQRLSKFAADRFRKFIIPWFVFSIILFVISRAVFYTPFRNAFEYTTFPDYLGRMFKGHNPYGFHLWYIYVLFFVELVSLLLIKGTDRILDSGAARAAALLLTGLCVKAAPDLNGVMAVVLFKQNLLYFILGYVVYDNKAFCLRLTRKISGRCAIAFTGTVSTIIYAVTLRDRVVALPENILLILKYFYMIAGGPCIVFSFVFLALRLERSSLKNLKRLLLFLGRNSYSIYLIHNPFFCAIAAMALLQVLGMSPLSLILVYLIVLPVSIIGPTVSVLAADRLRVFKFLLEILNLRIYIRQYRIILCR